MHQDLSPLFMLRYFLLHNSELCSCNVMQVLGDGKEMLGTVKTVAVMFIWILV